MNISKAIAERILELCNERNITVGKLCTIAGTTSSTISDIMNGITKNPGVITIKKLCDALDITLAEFFNTYDFNNAEQEIK